MNAKCACIVLNYNDAKTTIDLIKRIKYYSIFKYIVVVDNDSKDGSYHELLKLCSNHIRVIRTERNGGYGYGNNYGVQYANDILECNYIVIANPDVIFEERVIEKMLTVLTNNSDVSIVAPTQLDINGNIIDNSAWNIPTTLQYILFSEYILNKIYNKFCKLTLIVGYPYMIDVECVQGALFMVSALMFRKMKGFDTDLFLYGEETAIGVKSKENGYRTILLTQETYVHIHSVSIKKAFKSVTAQRKLLLQSRYIVLKKYLKANQLELFFARMFFMFVVFECKMKHVFEKIFIEIAKCIYL